MGQAQDEIKHNVLRKKAYNIQTTSYT